MDREQFQQHVFADPHLAEPIRRAASKGRPKQFGVITEAAEISLLKMGIPFSPSPQPSPAKGEGVLVGRA